MFGNFKSRSPAFGYYVISLCGVCCQLVGAPVEEPRTPSTHAEAGASHSPDRNFADAPSGDCPLSPAGLSDDSIDTFARRIAESDIQLAAQFRAALSTAAGKLALSNRVTNWSDARRNRLKTRALRDFFSVHFAENNGTFILRESKSWLRRRLMEHKAQYESEMNVLQPVIREIAARLRADGLTGRQLMALLDHAAGPSIAYETLVRPLAHPDPLQRILGKLFTTDDDGFQTIPSSQKNRAGLVLKQLLAGTTAFDELRSGLATFARDITEIDALHIRLRHKLEEPFLAAHLAHTRSRRLRRGQDMSPMKLMNEVLADMNATLERTPAGLRIKSSGFGAIKERLDDFDAMRTPYRFAKKRIDRFVCSLTTQGHLRDRWRQALGTELVAVWAADAELPQPPDVLGMLRNTTFLGTALIAEGSTYRINPRLTALVQVQLRRLRASLDEHAQFAGELDLLTHRIKDGTLQRMFQSPAGRFFVKEWVRDTVADYEGHELRQWARGYFDSMAVVRGHVVPEIESILEASRASHLLLPIDLKRLDFDNSHANILRSSSFYNPRTAFDVHTYQTEFEDHYAARVFGVFSLQARESTSLEDFRTRLYAQQRWLTELARGHDRLIINISDTPRWLSRVKTAPTDHNAHYHPPADFSIFGEMVKALVVFMRQCHPGPILYEFWSEPDARFLGTMDDFLSLYAVTANTIKSVDPAAKVGGAAVNHWNGSLSADRRQGAVNLALIRYAHKNRLPLDFISWHHFATDPAELLRAKQAFMEALGKSPFAPVPEFYLSEWNIPLNLRGSRYAAATAADYFVRFCEMDLTMQTVAAWVDFNPKPTIHDFSPYGLLTQQGHKRPEYFTHKFFDRLARDSQGVSIIKFPAAAATVVVSKKGPREYDMLLWIKDHRGPMRAAAAFLEAQGLSHNELGAYGGRAQLMDAILHVTPNHRRWQDAFTTARDIFLGHDESPTVVQLRFPGWGRVHVRSAQAVITSLNPKPVYAADNTIALELSPFELCRVRVSLNLGKTRR